MRGIGNANDLFGPGVGVGDLHLIVCGDDSVGFGDDEHRGGVDLAGVDEAVQVVGN